MIMLLGRDQSCKHVYLVVLPGHLSYCFHFRVSSILRRAAPYKYQLFRGIKLGMGATAVSAKIGTSEGCHLDHMDDLEGYAVLTCVAMEKGASWEGGNLWLPQIGMEISLEPGQILFFRACLLRHFSSPGTNLQNRIVFTGFTCNAIVSWAAKHSGVVGMDLLRSMIPSMRNKPIVAETPRSMDFYRQQNRSDVRFKPLAPSAKADECVDRWERLKLLAEKRRRQRQRGVVQDQGGQGKFVFIFVVDVVKGCWFL